MSQRHLPKQRSFAQPRSSIFRFRLSSLPRCPTSQGASSQRTAGSGNSRPLKRRYTMPRSGIGLEKAIPIRVWSNRIVVAGEFEIPVNAQVRTESLVERVLIAMDHVQSDWPSAGEGYHWVPTLKYDVVEIRPTEITGRAFELSRPWLHMTPGS